MELEKGWMKRQNDIAAAATNSWPIWMKKEAGIYMPEDYLVCKDRFGNEFYILEEGKRVTSNKEFWFCDYTKWIKESGDRVEVKGEAEGKYLMLVYNRRYRGVHMDLWGKKFKRKELKYLDLYTPGGWKGVAIASHPIVNIVGVDKFYFDNAETL